MEDQIQMHRVGCHGSLTLNSSIHSAFLNDSLWLWPPLFGHPPRRLLFFSHTTLKTTWYQQACAISQSGLSWTNRVTAFLLQAILIVYVIGKGDIFFPTYYISKRFLLNNSFPMWKGVVTRNNCTLCLEWLVSWRQWLSLMNQRLPSNGACFTEKNVWLTRCCDTVGLGFEVSYVQALTNNTIHFLLPAKQDAELSAPSPVPCLPTCYHVSPRQ